jgi:hypothetical protein
LPADIDIIFPAAFEKKSLLKLGQTFLVPFCIFGIPFYAFSFFSSILILLCDFISENDFTYLFWFSDAFVFL